MPNQESVIETFHALVRNTRYSVSFKFHYYCSVAEASLSGILETRDLLFGTSCREVPIEASEKYREGEGWETRVVPGALKKDRLPDRPDGAKQLRPTNFRATKRDNPVKAWERAVDDDLLAIDGALEEISKSRPSIQYLCLPEFGFPYFPIEKLSGAPRYAFDLKTNHPIWWTGALDKVSAALFQEHRFVCLGSAHVAMRSGTNKPHQYRNVSVVFPKAHDSSRRPEDIFRSKRDHVLAVCKGTKIAAAAEEVHLTTDGNGESLSAHFRRPDFTVHKRIDLDALSEEQKSEVSESAIRYSKDAFDYYNAMEKSRSAPIYVRKNNPALRMGEYLDPRTSTDINIFVTPVGVICTIICYDIFDPAIFLALVRHYVDSDVQDGTYRHPSPDIILIPSYNKHPDFVKICQTLSFETQSIVFYTSGYTACDTKSAIFICGMKLADLAEELGEGQDMKPVTAEDIRVGRITKAIYDKANNKSNIAQLQLGSKDQLEERRLGTNPLL